MFWVKKYCIERTGNWGNKVNILFIGKWDIAGAYISDRLIREGYSVCWMTDEEEGILWNKKFKGNIYRGIWRREDYLRILKANSIDVVVLLTGIFRENYEELPEYRSQMLDFTNLLNVLRNYPLKSLVYLSSLELDYDEIHTPVLTELLAGEMLCEAYHKAYALPIMIVRLGCVYGSFGLEKMGYTGQILQKMQQGVKLESLYSPDDYLDTIFGEDMAEAVFRLIKLGKQGSYRLMSGHPITMEEYYNALGFVTGYSQPVIWHGQKGTASREYFLSDNSVKMETGWMPFFLLPEKGKNLLKKVLKRSSNEERFSTRKAFFWKLRRLGHYSFLKEGLETIVLFILTCILMSYQTDVSDLKYVDIRLMFVVLVSCLHGMKSGALAIILASLSYIYSLNMSKIDISYLLYSVDTWIPFVVYMIAGAVVGYIVDRRKDEEANLRENYSLLMDKYEFLKSIHGETLEVKKSLQRQIITSKYSFGQAYEMTVELDSLKPELILLKVIGILEHIMECDQAAVFLVNSKNLRYARLKACSNKLREIIPTSLNMEQFPLIYKNFRENRLFVNTGLLENYPDYAAPVYYKEELYGFVAVYDISSEHFTVYYQNMFKIITSLIEKNLVKALEYENVQHDKLHFPGTELLYPQIFEDRLSIMCSESEEIAYTFILAKVYPLIPMSQEEVSATIASVIRGNDYMGIDCEGNYAVILVNMTKEYLGIVKDRFRNKNLSLEADETE